MWQPVLMINGYLISVLGLAMLIPAAVDMLETGRNWSLFVTSSIVSLFIGLSLFLGNRTKIEKITLQQGYLLTAVSWVSLTLLATLPFILSDVTPGFADALFEAMSGLSTTGATVITDLEVLPDSILLWRSMLNGLGGVGIVIFAVALLPFLGIGGMQIFQRENSDLKRQVYAEIQLYCQAHYGGLFHFGCPVRRVSLFCGHDASGIGQLCHGGDCYGRLFDQERFGRFL